MQIESPEDPAAVCTQCIPIVAAIVIDLPVTSNSTAVLIRSGGLKIFKILHSLAEEQALNNFRILQFDRTELV